MTAINKPVVGYRQCDDCGQRATVHQAAGRRRQLYQRCGCGCVQANGKYKQSELWFETDWLDGMKPEESPAAIYTQDEYLQEMDAMVQRKLAKRKPVSADRKDQSASGLQPDPETGHKPEVKPDLDRDPEPDDTGKTDKSGLYWLAGGLTLLAAMVGRA